MLDIGPVPPGRSSRPPLLPVQTTTLALVHFLTLNLGRHPFPVQKHHPVQKHCPVPVHFLILTRAVTRSQSGPQLAAGAGTIAVADACRTGARPGDCDVGPRPVDDECAASHDASIDAVNGDIDVRRTAGANTRPAVARLDHNYAVGADAAFDDNPVRLPDNNMVRLMNYNPFGRTGNDLVVILRTTGRCGSLATTASR